MAQDATLDYRNWLVEQVILLRTPSASPHQIGNAHVTTDARRTAEYWKAEHIAANAELATLKANYPEKARKAAEALSEFPIAPYYEDEVKEVASIILRVLNS